MSGKPKKTGTKGGKKQIKTVQKTFNMALDLQDEQLTSGTTPLSSQVKGDDDQFIVYKSNMNKKQSKIKNEEVQQQNEETVKQNTQQSSSQQQINQIVPPNKQISQNIEKQNVLKNEEVEQLQSVKIQNNPPPYEKQDSQQAGCQQIAQFIEQQKHKSQNQKPSPIIIQNQGHNHKKQQQIDLQAELQEGQHVAINKKLAVKNKAKGKAKTNKAMEKKQKVKLNIHLKEVDQEEVPQTSLPQETLLKYQPGNQYNQVQKIQKKQNQNEQIQVDKLRQVQAQQNQAHLEQRPSKITDQEYQIKTEPVIQQQKQEQKIHGQEQKLKQQAIQQITTEFVEDNILQEAAQEIPTLKGKQSQQSNKEQVKSSLIQKQLEHMQDKLNAMIHKTQQICQNLSKKSQRKQSAQMQQQLDLPKQEKNQTAPTTQMPNQIMNPAIEPPAKSSQNTNKSQKIKNKQKSNISKNKPKTKAHSTIKMQDVCIDFQEQQINKGQQIKIMTDIGSIKKDEEEGVENSQEIPNFQNSQILKSNLEQNKNQKNLSNEKLQIQANKIVNQQPLKILEAPQEQQMTVPESHHEQVLIQKVQLQQNKVDELDLAEELSFTSSKINNIVKPDVKPKKQSKKIKTTKKGFTNQNNIDDIVQQSAAPLIEEKKPEQQKVQTEQILPQDYKEKIAQQQKLITKQDAKVENQNHGLPILIQPQVQKQPQIQAQTTQKHAQTSESAILEQLNSNQTSNNHQELFQQPLRQTPKFDKPVKNSKKVGKNSKTGKTTVTSAKPIQKIEMNQDLIFDEQIVVASQTTKNQRNAEKQQKIIQSSQNNQSKQLQKPKQIQQNKPTPTQEAIKQQKAQIETEKIKTQNNSQQKPQLTQDSKVSKNIIQKTTQQKQQKQSEVIKITKNTAQSKKKNKKVVAAKKFCLQTMDQNFMNQNMQIQQSKVQLVSKNHIQAIEALSEQNFRNTEEQKGVLQQSNKTPMEEQEKKIINLTQQNTEKTEKQAQAQKQPIIDPQTSVNSQNVGPIKQKIQNIDDLQKQKEDIFQDFKDNPVLSLPQPENNLHEFDRVKITEQIYFDEKPTFRPKTIKPKQKKQKGIGQKKLAQNSSQKLKILKQNTFIEQSFQEKQGGYEEITQLQPIKQRFSQPAVHKADQEKPEKLLARAAANPIQKTYEVVSPKPEPSVNRTRVEQTTKIRQKSKLDDKNNASRTESHHTENLADKNLVSQLVSIVTIANSRNLNAMKQRLMMMRQDISSLLLRRQQKQTIRCLPQAHYGHLIQQNVELKEHLSGKENK